MLVTKQKSKMRLATCLSVRKDLISDKASRLGANSSAVQRRVARDDSPHELT